MTRVAAADLSRRTRWVAYAIGAFGLGMGNAIVFLMPLRARELGSSFEFIGLLIAAGALAPVLLSVPLGAVIDRFGPRRNFVLGTSLCAVFGLAGVLVEDHRYLLVLQLALGTARILAWIASQTYITAVGRAGDRAAVTGRFSFFSNIGIMLGPLIVGALAEVIGLRWSFGFLALYGAAFAALGYFLDAPSDAAGGGDRRRVRGVGFRAAGHLMAVRGVQMAMVLTAVRLWISWSWTSFYPVYLVENGLTPGIAGSVVALNGAVATLASPTVGFWRRFARPPTISCIALALGALGLVVSPHLTTVPAVFLPALPIGIGAGLSLPLLMTIIGDSAPGEQRGTALGMRQVSSNVAAGGAPMLIGPLVTALGFAGAFAVGGAAAVAALGGVVALHLTDKAGSIRDVPG